jgi:uncharacterized membrane protein YdfJ with MMPL/SSD domain
MYLFELKFNLANLIIIPLIVAPGVENGLLIIHRFREEAESAVLPRSIGKGVALSSLTTMVGFGSLMIAHHRGASSIGLLVTLGVGAVLVVSVIVLPALLTVVARKKVPSSRCQVPNSAPETRHPTPETANSIPNTRNCQPEFGTRNPEPGTRNKEK